jgi:hypothetical protein
VKKQSGNLPRIVRDIAHARASDKGNTSNISVWVYDPADFELLKSKVTTERLKQTYPDLVRGDVERYVLEHLHGLNLVLQDALEGGVNSSLNLDSHGKSWSYLILRLELRESSAKRRHPLSSGALTPSGMGMDRRSSAERG